MSQKLAGKIALITGGNGGLGLAAAKHFVAEGAQVSRTLSDQVLAWQNQYC
jgi:NAD(P)-dependent dehydrogenase (short-subunit alcohol dehydrogenase family)